MTRATLIEVIRDHIESALWCADNLPTTPGQIMLRDTLVGALQEAHVLYPAAEERENATRGHGL